MAHAEEACLTYSIITNWISALIRGEDIQVHISDSGHLVDNRVDTLVVATLEEFSYHSMRSLASTIKISPTTYGDIYIPKVILYEIYISFLIYSSRLKKSLESNRWSNWLKFSIRGNIIIGATF
jgi:hypothetical protein